MKQLSRNCCAGNFTKNLVGMSNRNFPMNYISYSMHVSCKSVRSSNSDSSKEGKIYIRQILHRSRSGIRFLKNIARSYNFLSNGKQDVNTSLWRASEKIGYSAIKEMYTIYM